MMEDFLVAVAPGSHHCCADLTQAYTVSPACAVKSEGVLTFLNDKSRAVQMGF